MVKNDEKNMKNKLLGDAAVLTFVKVVTTATGMLQAMILAHGLEKSAYGLYAQGLIIVTTATSISLIALNDAINFFYNRTDKKDIKEQYVNTIFLIECILGGGCGVAILLFRHSIANYFNSSGIATLLVFVAFRPLLQNIIYLYQVLYISNNLAKAIAVRNFMVSILQVCVTYVLVSSHCSVTAIFIWLLLLDAVQLIFFALFYKKHIGNINPFHVDAKKANEILRWTIPLGIAVMSSVLMNEMDKLFISHYMDIETLAMYSNVSRMLPLGIVTASFSTLVVPHVTRFVHQHNRVKLQKIMRTYISLGYTISFLLALCVITCAPEVIRIIYSEKYIEGKIVFCIYALIAALNFCYYGLLLNTAGKTKSLLNISIVGLLANMLLNYIGFKFFGITGPALATLICALFIDGSQLYMGAKETDVNLVDALNPRWALFWFSSLIGLFFIAHRFKQFLYQIGCNYLFVIFFTWIGIGSVAACLCYRKAKQWVKDLKDIE